MGNSADHGSAPSHACPNHRYLAELERLPDGSLRASLYRDGQPVHREWVTNQRRGRRRVIDLICTAIDTDPGNGTDSDATRGLADRTARE